MLTTLGLEESIANGWPIVMLASIDHPVEETLTQWSDGIIRLWSGVGTLEYDGQQWLGVGPFGRVSGIGGSKRLTVREVTFELMGIPATHRIYLDSRLRNRPAKAWVAGMDATGTRINGEPFQEVDGLCDYQELKVEENGQQTIILHVSEPVYAIERAQTLSYTPEWLNEWLRTWRDRNLGGARITGLDKMSDLANAIRSWTRT